MPRRAAVHTSRATPARQPDRRPSASARGYDVRWQRYRLWFLARHPLCECDTECCPDGCHQPASHVDHITPVTSSQDGAFWRESNHQGLSASCHSRKTCRDQQHGTTRRWT